MSPAMGVSWLNTAKNDGAIGQLWNLLVWISNTGDGIWLVYVCSFFVVFLEIMSFICKN